ncbi:gliding-associated putative ABC transporter substrate-binding component GldG [Cellulophaga sp. RHA_52]|uniref:gliding motility-associated ABC transporter substrate-binding protein GldG n=1 Tax=Cellulophaga sp. RHA_52 TaxID=1250036 RepID=UPI0011993A91|nr:gliding motility-associated ABC transporter substrate-binding protein GldG [Cellulophaga sp. RHA_52]TVZ09660.1 gliding-associated putative ABC transporter substrate-binding component GldG [Cellulophaga sp. RHA_52]
MKKTLTSIAIGIIALVVLNIASNYIYTRIDVTEDSRYTLSSAALQTVQNFTNPVIIDVLLEGQLPGEFVKLQSETKQILEEFKAENSNIKFNFINPLETTGSSENAIAEMQKLGLTPANVTVEENGKVSQEFVFPWAIVNYNNKTVKVALLKNKLGATTEERVTNSIQHLEYSFADAFSKLNIKDKKRIAVIKGNGELQDIYLADYLSTIKEYYNIGAFTLDSVASNPEKTLTQLKEYDLALIAKPTEPFTDKEKYVLDQYIVNGGKSMWLIDNVSMELDSLFNNEGKSLAFPRDLNLKDFFFKYGIRINPALVKDIYATQIVLAQGDGNNSQYNPVPWPFNPMVFSRNDHPINNNLEALRLQFANSIDVLNNNEYNKHILYYSSPLSTVVGTPNIISLDLVNKAPNKEEYNNGNKPLAVLVEGKFKSVYNNRIKPFALKNNKEVGTNNKMLVIADGDVIKNQISKGKPLQLGYDKWTNNAYGNKDFMVNSINYLLDDSGLINIRTKKVAIPFLDKEKIVAQKTKWQLINIALPVVLTLLFGLIFNYYRKHKYGK